MANSERDQSLTGFQPDTATVHGDDEAGDALRRLAHDLIEPPFAIDPLALCGQWTIDRLQVACERPPELEEYPELALRIRGAFGRALQQTPVGRNRHGQIDRPPAFDALYGTLGHRTAGVELPKPTVFRAGIEDDHLIVELGLVGWASLWLQEARAAMCIALEGGIALRESGRRRVACRVKEVRVQRQAFVMVRSSPTVVALHFRTPVVVRAGRSLAGDGRAILRAVPRQVASLARWQGLRLDADWKGLAEDIERLDIDDGDLQPYAFSRYSQRQGGQPIPVAGYLGRLRAAGDLTALAPFLAIAETINIGSHASLGLGAFDLALA